MIRKLRLVRAIGQFDSVDSAATIDLAKLTLVYAENARGKTTLAAILRSLSTGEALPINMFWKHDASAFSKRSLVADLPGRVGLRRLLRRSKRLFRYGC